ncbi:MAG: DUF4860 domain-containing protein [Clostridia bacterium]|nr:DUF4860 domain-containing protein [Clostridia bacterium]
MKKRNFGFDVIAGLFLVCVFAASLFFTLASGARIYKDVSAVMEEQYTSRTALGYVTAKLHQSDAAGCVSLETLGEVPALVISEEFDGVLYKTFVYCWDGYITELFCPASEPLLPSDGLPVIAAEKLEFSIEGRLMRIDCFTSAGEATAYVGLVSRERGAA